MTAQPLDTDPSVIAHPVFRYSEWLDSQGLMRGDNEDAALAALDTAKYDADWLTEKNAELLDAVVDLIAQRDRARDIAVALEQELAEVKGQTLGYLMIERYENSTLKDVIDDDGDGSSVRPMNAPPSFTEVPDGYVVVALVGQA